MKVIALLTLMSFKVMALDLDTVKCSNNLRVTINALDSCSNLVKIQDDQITILKKTNADLIDQLADKDDDSFSIPWYAYTLLGVITGGLLVNTIKK
jgi:hypothetical protein